MVGITTILGAGLLGAAVGLATSLTKTKGTTKRAISVLGGLAGGGGIVVWSQGGEKIGSLIASLSIGFIIAILIGLNLRSILDESLMLYDKGPPPSSMNKELVSSHFMRLIEIGEVDMSIIMNDYCAYTNGHEEHTIEELLAIVSTYREAFPDLQVTIEDSFATDKTVTLRYTLTGTHRRKIHRVAPAGTRVEIHGVSVYRVKDGLLAESWHVTDLAGLNKT